MRMYLFFVPSMPCVDDKVSEADMKRNRLFGRRLGYYTRCARVPLPCRRIDSSEQCAQDTGTAVMNGWFGREEFDEERGRFVEPAIGGLRAQDMADCLRKHLLAASEDLWEAEKGTVVVFGPPGRFEAAAGVLMSMPITRMPENSVGVLICDVDDEVGIVNAKQFEPLGTLEPE